MQQIRVSPLERYRKALEGTGFARDPAQQRAVERLDRLYVELAAGPARPPGWVKRAFRSAAATPPAEVKTPPA